MSSVKTLLNQVTTELPGGGEERPGQLEMAEAVAASIEARRNLVAAAGTGTGKSLAYLVPAIASGKRAVVATATKALQEQLAKRDLPFLQEHTGVDFDFALLKGRSNYLCKQRLSELNAAGDQQTLAVDDNAAEQGKVDKKQVAKIEKWEKKTHSGDRAELPFEPSARTWSALSVGPAECPGASKCPHGEECYTELARARAQEADITVVNTHLYALDLISDGAILGDHDVVIVDEAHQLEDIVAAAAGFELTGGRLRTLASTIGSIVADPTLRSDLTDIAEQLIEDLEPLEGERIKRDELGDDLERTLQRARQRAERAIDTLKQVPKDAPDDIRGRKERAVRAATQLMNDIDLAVELTDDSVAWVDGGRSPSLNVASIDVAKLLRDKLWGERSSILTSATIPRNICGRLGLDPAATTQIDVGSPFDFENAGLLYCASHLPDPRAADYRDAIHDEIEDLVLAAGGRSLVLFTSWRSMNLARDHLIDRLPYKLLVQGESPKEVLVDTFMEDESSVLLATMSFWQGVDLPGRSLSCVIIDRLPFPRPDDPLLEARREQVGGAAFREIDLPRAAMLLAQGAGRLVRTEDDRGVVAVLDKRLATSKSYRWELIKALPPLKRTKDRTEALDFLKTIRDGTAASSKTTA